MQNEVFYIVVVISDDGRQSAIFYNAFLGFLAENAIDNSSILTYTISKKTKSFLHARAISFVI